MFLLNGMGWFQNVRIQPFNKPVGLLVYFVQFHNVLVDSGLQSSLVEYSLFQMYKILLLFQKYQSLFQSRR